MKHFRHAPELWHGGAANQNLAVIENYRPDIGGTIMPIIGHWGH
jgi:hypothetical protein